MKEIITNIVSILTAIICTIFPIQITVTEPAKPEFPDYTICDKTLDVFNEVNKARIENGVAPLILDEKLCALAYVRAKEQIEQSGHTRPDGRKYNTVLSDYDYWYRNNGENIVITRGFSGEFSVECWLNSESHKKNMLKDFWTHTGVGIYVEGNRYFIVQLFVHKK